MKDLKQHAWHYLTLVIILLVGGIAFLTSTEKIFRFEIGALMAIAYIFWGFIHHHLENNLKPKIMVEYTLIGALAVILLGGVLL